ncbi:MFS transporter [Haloferula sp. BvORR071]|uniref:MDR family MFS transporter n=1 Tax=Haloferula sp. BvORR071 TaxID=1396141 RepID=UPI00054E68AB|nr:MFS transporter [Haloferula sp. BvORR071]
MNAEIAEPEPEPHSTLWQDLRALPTEYWILFSGTLVNRFGHFVIPFLAIYMRQQGHNAAATSLTLGAYGAGALIAGAIGGYLADRIGRRATMLVACTGSALSMLLLSLAHSVPELVAVTFMNGLLSAIYGPAAAALIADLVPLKRRVRAFSCQRFAINLGFAAGMATAGFMAEKSFAALFIADAATTTILGLLVLFGIKPRPRIARERSGWAPALRHMKTNVPFQLATTAGFLIGIVFWQMSSSYALQATKGAGLDERAYGLLMALNGILIVFAELPLTSYTKRFPPILTMASGYLIIGLGMGMNALGASTFLLIASMVVFTVGEMIALPVNSGYMSALAPDEMRGRYQGVMSISWSTATMIGPSMGITLYEYSPPLLWSGIFVLCIVAAGLTLAGGSKRFRRTALPAQAQAEVEAEAGAGA